MNTLKNLNKGLKGPSQSGPEGLMKAALNEGTSRDTCSRPPWRSLTATLKVLKVRPEGPYEGNHGLTPTSKVLRGLKDT